MSSSAIRINVVKPADEGEPYTVVLPRIAPGRLTDCDQDPGRDYEVTIDSAQLNDHWVFRCQLTPQSESDPRTVIIKTARMDAPYQDTTALNRREKEASHYVRELKTLQGKAVPQFLGFYKGEYTTRIRKQKIILACILLEDCGESISSTQWETVRFKVWIGNVLARFHLHTHLNHNSLTRNHILVAGQRLVLINFNKVTTHDCKFSRIVSGVKFRDIISQQLPDPGPELISCIEIYKYCQNMALFIPSTYEYNRSKVKIDSRMQSAEDLAHVVRCAYPDPMYEKTLTLWSQRTWLEVEKNLDKYSLAPWAAAKYRTNRDKDRGVPSGGEANNTEC